MQTFEKLVKEILSEKQITQRQISKRMGYSPDAFNKWLKEINKIPTEAVDSFCHLLELSPGIHVQLLKLAGYKLPLVSSIASNNVILQSFEEFKPLAKQLNIETSLSSEIVEHSDLTAIYVSARDHFDKREYEKAVPYWSEIISRDHDDIEALYYLGLCIEKIKRNHSVRSAVQLYRRARSHIAAGDYETARLLIHQSLALNPKFEEAYSTLMMLEERKRTARFRDKALRLIEAGKIEDLQNLLSDLEEYAPEAHSEIISDLPLEKGKKPPNRA